MKLVIMIAQAVAMSPPANQPFEFGPLSTVRETTAEIRRLNCKPNEDHTSEYCMQVPLNFSGRLGLGIVYLRNGKLESMSLQVSRMNLDTARQALTMKYGKECSTDTWCFSSGKLTLERSYGPIYDPERIELRYKDMLNIAPTKKSPSVIVDF